MVYSFTFINLLFVAITDTGATSNSNSSSQPLSPQGSIDYINAIINNETIFS